LVFQCLVPVKNWKIETKAVFNEDGITSIIVNVRDEKVTSMTASRNLFEDSEGFLDELWHN
jgi:hypothetical protein